MLFKLNHEDFKAYLDLIFTRFFHTTDPASSPLASQDSSQSSIQSQPSELEYKLLMDMALKEKKQMARENLMITF